MEGSEAPTGAFGAIVPHIQRLERRHCTSCFPFRMSFWSRSLHGWRQREAGARVMYSGLEERVCAGSQGSCLAATDALETPVVRCGVRRCWRYALHSRWREIKYQ